MKREEEACVMKREKKEGRNEVRKVERVLKASRIQNIWSSIHDSLDDPAKAQRPGWRGHSWVQRARYSLVRLASGPVSGASPRSLLWPGQVYLEDQEGRRKNQQESWFRQSNVSGEVLCNCFIPLFAHRSPHTHPEVLGSL